MTVASFDHKEEKMATFLFENRSFSFLHLLSSLKKIMTWNNDDECSKLITSKLFFMDNSIRMYLYLEYEYFEEKKTLSNWM